MNLHYTWKQTMAAALAGLLLLTGLTGCSGPSEETNERYSTPLPAQADIVWVTDNTAHLYGQPDNVPVPKGAIGIDTAEEFCAIGVEDGYPLDGDYVLTTDLDLTGVELSPIGGAPSACGIVSGSNVFSGTFDGRGHTLRGVTMEFSESTRVHVGLFGSVGSDDADDPAVIKNLILKDVSLSGSFSDVYTMGALAGQFSGYVEIDNIALLSGSVTVTTGTSTLGVGGLVGQIRTNTDTGCTNGGVKITDVYTGIQVEGGEAGTTSGLIGRIRASDLGELSRIVVTGQAKVGKAKGRAICGGDSSPIVSENIWYLNSAGEPHGDIGTSKSSSSLQTNLPGSDWQSGDGIYALPKMVWNSGVFSPALDFLVFRVSPGDRVDHVEFNFTLPTTTGGQPVTWTSDDPDHLAVSGGSVTVTKPKHGSVYAHLTAAAGDVSRTYTLRIVSGEETSLHRDGNWLIAEGYPAGTEYCWVMENLATGEESFQWNTSGRLLLSGLSPDTRVYLRSEGYDELSYVTADIATLYIDCKTGYYSLGKGTGDTATLLLETQDGKTEYTGGAQIKLRGNSSAWQEKRPFKLKLDTKADLFGMGKNKHWVLLANWYDRTNLRNVLSYEMSGELGMWYCESVFVDLYYNGEYYGLYQLCENIRVDDERVDIFDWDEAAEEVAKLCAADHGLSVKEEEQLALELGYDLSWVTSGRYGKYDLQPYITKLDLSIDGGYLIENDSYNDEPTKFTTENGVMYMVTTPNSLVESREMFRYVKDYFQDIEDAIFSPTRRNANGDHYMDLMDMESFADFWYVNEFFKNGEILYKSTFLYLDHGEKLGWGPVWDMDWAGGNHVNLGESGQNPAGWVHGGGDRQVWSRSMFTDPYTALVLYEEFDEDVIASMDKAVADLDLYAAKLEVAAVRDNERWRYPDSYEEEIDLFREWLTGRRDWMNTQFDSPQVVLDSLHMYEHSPYMAVTSGKIDGDKLTLTLTLADGAATHGRILVNGVDCGTAALSETVTVTLPAGTRDKTESYDAVQILGADENGECRVLRQRGGIEGCDIWDSAHTFIEK